MLSASMDTGRSTSASETSKTNIYEQPESRSQGNSIIKNRLRNYYAKSPPNSTVALLKQFLTFKTSIKELLEVRDKQSFRALQ